MASRASQLVLVVKNLHTNPGDVRDRGLIPGWRRSPGERHGNSLQYSWLENPKDRRACWAAVHRVAKSRTRLKRLICSHPRLESKTGNVSLKKITGKTLLNNYGMDVDSGLGCKFVLWLKIHFKFQCLQHWMLIWKLKIKKMRARKIIF